MIHTLTRLVILFVIVIMLSSCALFKKITPPQQIGAWLVYWDGDRGLSELETHGVLFNRVSMFAYELDPQGMPQHTPGFMKLMPNFFLLAKKHGFSPWVTIVNDVRTINKVLMKDTEVLHQLMADPELRKKHVKDIVVRVKEDGFVGLDLDYERLEVLDQNNFHFFVEELGDELKRNGLGFNVVIEPQRGPLPSPGTTTLTVMGYNLYGTHSGPGPRSTPAFIATLVGRVNGDAKAAPELALAVGGFSWAPDGRVKQLDWVSGQRLAESAVKKGRGPFTRVPHARLGDGTEVWFEDAESLRAKWDAAYKAGFRSLMIWRLGGNDDSLFQLLYNYRKLQAGR
ncbi:MAG: hypothetical protein NT096_11020 [Proteobacteria bacterium]|nr:hypothetical protein [Pseudomonadota bacterium]